MVGGCSVCPCFESPATSDDGHVDMADRDPVLLVTGMGGSILHSKSKRKIFGFDTRVWVRIFLADLEFKRRLWSIYNPTTGYTEELDENSEIVVPDDDHGLYAIDILDPSLIFSKYVSKWICIACPFQGKLLVGIEEEEVICTELILSLYSRMHIPNVTGAPGCINDALLTGLQFIEGFESYFFVGRWTMHQLVIECPSIYEMLPNPVFEWKKTPQIQVWRKVTPDKEDEEAPPSAKLESYGPLQSTVVFQEALRHNELDFNGKTFALPFNYDILKWAAGTRQLINKAKLPKGIDFYNISGTSFETPFDVCYGSETSPICDLSEICHTLPEYSFVDGDETVPIESAQGDGFDAVERVAIPARHRELLCDKTTFQYIQKWLGVSSIKHKKPSKTSKVMDSVYT
ncbi:hypothetical protein KSS87_002154 [Heliosperma pusillum]|nr:hypothetical protein KSS87_002154 [Heliosperma pusillum]